MGDALCGPSNPLQNFRKQTQADRSLQQDRLATRNQPGQGFRSSPGPNAGILDAEFEAFQNGSPLAPPPQDLHFAPPHAPTNLQPQSFSPAPAAAGWAADFQRLRISQPPPPQHQQHTPQKNLSSWHNDFMQQNQPTTFQHAPQTNYQPQMYQPFSSGMSYMSPSPMLSSNEQYTNSATAFKGKERETFDDAAFEREFEMHESRFLEAEIEATMDEARKLDAATAEAQQAARAKSHMDSSMDHLKEWADALNQNDAEQAMHDLEWARQAAAHEPPAQADQQAAAPDVDVDADLARTAGELLERVADDDSEKFLNSEFFSLMRRVRDGAATIRDGQMLDDGKTAEPARSIPASEQDHDVGRDVRMAGALRPSAATVADAAKGAATAWNAEQYGGHSVDDF